jgi:hypothetical protein
MTKSERFALGSMVAGCLVLGLIRLCLVVDRQRCVVF